jgi:P pilus assembly chaperone PapD
MIRMLFASLLAASLCGCAITSVASAAVSVASTAVSVTAKVVETTVDVGAAGVKAVTGSDAPMGQD